MKFHFAVPQKYEQVIQDGRRTMCGVKPIMAGMATNLTSLMFFGSLTPEQQKKYVCAKCVEHATAKK